MNKRDQKDVGKYLDSYLSTPYGLRSSYTRRQQRSAHLFDSDEEANEDARVKQASTRHQYYQGRDLSFKKLYDDCEQLNQNMNRAKIILGINKKKDDGKDAADSQASYKRTNELRLYGLHYNQMVQDYHRRGGNAAGEPTRTLGQLEQLLTYEMQRDQQARKNADGGQDGGYSTAQIGRDFMAGKGFEVGDLEQDIRDAWNFQLEITEKYMPRSAMIDATPSGWPGAMSGAQDLQIISNQDAPFQNNGQSYRKMLIQEGINSNQQVQFQKQDRSFYSKLTKQFKLSQKTFDVVQGEFDFVTNRHDIKIQQNPLSQMHVPREKEKFLADDENMDINQIEQRIVKNEISNKNILLQNEDEAFDNILAGKGAFESIDRGVLKTMLKNVEKMLINELPVRKITFKDHLRRGTILMLQRPLHKFVYKLRTIEHQDWGKSPNTFTMGKVAGQSLAKKADIAGQTFFDQMYKTAGDFMTTNTAKTEDKAAGNPLPQPPQNPNTQIKVDGNSSKHDHELFLRRELAKSQALAQLSEEITNEQEKALSTYFNSTFTDTMNDTISDEKEIILSMWIAIANFAKDTVNRMNAFVDQIDLQKREQPNGPSVAESIRESYEKELLQDQLNLFNKKNTYEHDRNKATILAQALQEKFSMDLGIYSGPKSDQEIISKLNNWVLNGIQERAAYNLQNELYYDQRENCYPYPLIFMLFVSGQHSIGLRVAKQFCSTAFFEMYQDYFKNYKAKGLPQEKISHYQERVMVGAFGHQNEYGANYEGSSLTTNPRQVKNVQDKYRDLLVHIMSGNLYPIDDDFIHIYLFSNFQFQTWIYLKLASFEHIEGQNDKNDDKNMLFQQFNAPLNYERFTLLDFQELAQQKLVAYKKEKKELSNINFGYQYGSDLSRNKLHVAFQLFFSGQFTLAMRFLLNEEEKFFIDVCHMSVPLQRLNLLKTKFLFTSLLHMAKTKQALLKIHNQQQLRDIYLNRTNDHQSCIDLVALLGYYMNQMSSVGEEAEADQPNAMIRDQCYNGMTDATCFSYVMEDDQVSEAFLARYVLNNIQTALQTVLEYKGQEYLYFKDSAVQQQAISQRVENNLSILTTPIKNLGNANSAIEGSNKKSLGSGGTTAKSKKKTLKFDTMKLELRNFLGDNNYKRFVLKLIEFNEVDKQQEINDYINGNQDNNRDDSYQFNILLLERLCEHKRVLQMFNRIQISNISHRKSKEFLKTDLDKQVLERFYKKQMKVESDKKIQLVNVQREKQFNDKMRDQSFVKFPELKAQYEFLKIISEALNFITDGEFKFAQAHFEKLKALLPILDTQKDQAHQFCKKFYELDKIMQWVLLDVIIATSKCLYILAMEVIQQETGAGGMEFGQSTNSQKNRVELKKRNQQVKNLAIFIDSVENVKDQGIGGAAAASADQQMTEKINQIGVMIRKIVMYLT